MSLYGLDTKRKPVAAAAPVNTKRFAANAKRWAKGQVKPTTSQKLYPGAKQ